MALKEEASKQPAGECVILGARLCALLFMFCLHFSSAGNSHLEGTKILVGKFELN